MLFKKTNNPGSDIKWYDIMDKEKYINRRKFIIGGNKVRLISAIHYNTHRIYIRRILTHAEYDRGDWKE